MEDSGPECDLVNTGEWPLEVSEEKDFSMLPGDYSDEVLVKNMAAFGLCLKSLPEAKLESLD